jgi:hypothetical protein
LVTATADPDLRNSDWKPFEDNVQSSLLEKGGFDDDDFGDFASSELNGMVLSH